MFLEIFEILYFIKEENEIGDMFEIVDIDIQYSILREKKVNNISKIVIRIYLSCKNIKINFKELIKEFR